MGFIIKFILFFTVVYFILKAFVRWFFGWGRNTRTRAGQQNQHPANEQETQEERIISYQKKSFEKSEAEDVDFVEIKDADPKH